MMNPSLSYRLLERFLWAEAKESGKGLGYLAPCFCGDGWFSIIWSMLEDIEKIYELQHLQIDTEIYQITEKYGVMRVYTIGGCAEVSKIILKYEKQSEHVCEECGDSGETCEIGGWTATLCIKCKERM